MEVAYRTLAGNKGWTIIMPLAQSVRTLPQPPEASGKPGANAPMHAIRTRFSLGHILPFVGVLCVLVLQAPRSPAPFDDAFITFRYARNLAAGAGFVYNPGQPVLGTTTPLLTAVLALIAAIAGPVAIPLAAFLIALLADAVSAWLLFRLGRDAFDDRYAALLLSLAFALSPFRLAVAIGGMEASLFTLLLLLSFQHLVMRRDELLGSLFAALSVLTRPDALIALVPIFAFLLLRARRLAIRAAVLVGALLLPWALWAGLHFGSPLPNPVLAKSVAYEFPPGFAAYFVLSFLATGTVAQYAISRSLLLGWVLGVTVVTIGVVHTALRRARVLPLVLYGPFYLILMTVANAPMFFPWYFYPLLPSLLLAVAACVWFLPVRSLAARRWLLTVTFAVTLLVPAVLMQDSPSWPLSREREAAYWEACDRLEARISLTDVVLAPDIGVIGWCLPTTEILDPVGLVSPEALAYLETGPERSAIPLSLVLTARPDYIVALQQYTSSTLAPSPDFAAKYDLAWSQPVSIAGRSQPLLIYQRTAP